MENSYGNSVAGGAAGMLSPQNHHRGTFYQNNVISPPPHMGGGAIQMDLVNTSNNGVNAGMGPDQNYLSSGPEDNFSML